MTSALPVFRGASHRFARSLGLATLFCAGLLVAPGLRAANDILIADFEGANYGDWKVTGEAFGPGPARGTLPGQMQVSGFEGAGLVNSYFNGDDSTGILTSPSFRIERRYIRFLIGGGKNPEKTCMNLVIDGKVVCNATGPNDRPGGSEALAPEAWEVSEFAGKTAFIQIVDQGKGGWGHINVDQIVQTDRKPVALVTDAKREFKVEHRYLNLPIKNGAPKRKVATLVEGRVELVNDIELADGEPDWWAPMDVSAWKGKILTLQVDQLPEDSKVLSSIEPSDSLKGAEDLYREKLRPQFHFSPRRGWNNDPNGLVYYQGEYHLFFQHNPYGWDWGNMHWGHAVSPDLVHWKELPIALFPDEHGVMFSGSAVVDWNNTSGFQTGEEKVLVCFFTIQGNPITQGMAYSNDRGRTWTKYDKNPIIPHIVSGNRDPKVLWYAPENKWILALYLDKPDARHDFALFSSKDLKHWEKMSEVTLAGTSECPEFFEIAVDGNAQNTRWIFYGGDGRYLVGKFDGHTFMPESGPHQLHFGNSFYASQTYNDLPVSDGRRILIPWGQMSTPGMPFNQMMGLPVELTLHGTSEGPRLFVNPVRELALLRTKTHTVKPQPLAPGDNPLTGVKGELFDIAAELQVGDASELVLNVRGMPVTYNVRKEELACNGRTAPLKVLEDRIRLRVLVDRTSIDIFGNDGRRYMPIGVIVPQDNCLLELSAKGGTARISALEVHELKSSWK